jgi:putative redox protein
MEFRSSRVEFAGGSGHKLGGIVDQPLGEIVAAGVFTHCFTCNKDLKAIVRISRALAAQGILVLRYDLTGLGSSDGDFSQTNFTTNRADLLAAVDFLSAEYQAPDFLIGHSFGGACSLSMAAEIDSVRALISLASPSDTSHLADLLCRMDPEIQNGSGTVSIGGRSYTITRQMVDDFRRHDLSSSISQLSKPTLLLHSPEDETLGFEHALRIYGLLTQSAGDDKPSPASLVCLDGADHLLAKNPQDLVFVSNLMASWIQRYAVS